MKIVHNTSRYFKSKEEVHEIFLEHDWEVLVLGSGATFMDAKVEALKNINRLARDVARLQDGKHNGDSTDNDPKGS